MLVAVAILGACSGDDGTDFCKNHYLFHPDHLDTAASLSIEVSDTGDVDGRLILPFSAAGDLPPADLENLLSDQERAFALQSEMPCAISLINIDTIAETYNASYAANCGSGNKLGKVNVALFDHLADLNEIVVSVATPATAKHFGINRQCDKPIFRLTK